MNKLEKFLAQPKVLRFIKLVKPILLCIMILIFWLVANAVIEVSQFYFILVCSILLIIDMIIFDAVDSVVIRILSKEIVEAAGKTVLGLGQIRRELKDQEDFTVELKKLAIKYARCWFLLRKAFEVSDNKHLEKYMDDVENMVNDEVDDLLKKIDNGEKIEN